MKPEGGQPEIVLSILPESGARCTDDLGILQKVVKKLPGFHPFRALEPDIRRVHSAGKRNILPAQHICDHPCIFHIIIDILMTLFHALICEYLRRSILEDRKSVVKASDV